ncbi:MAG: hypothetical protein A2309_05735 [Bacteroidetes bacterium RIFOXYB2_FULL_35_7]|nr:MAG: hypothetical protein A2309_05735 [Bacteroidetes bacterium RIFOXYB2_FULL_35_7]
MFELIHQIQGPQFLLIFLTAIFVSYILYRVYLKTSDALREDVYSPSKQINPYELAVLKGKGNVPHFLKTILISLYDKKLIVLREDGTIIKTENSDCNKLTEGEKVVLRFFNPGQKAQDVFKDAGIKATLRNEIEKHKESLSMQNLLKPTSMLSKQRLVWILFWSLLMIFGIIKFSMGLNYDKPVLFLLILLLFAFFLYLFSFPRRISKNGKMFMRGLAEKFSDVKNAKPNEATLPSGMDPVMVGALFGMGALFMFPEYSALEKQYPNQTSNYSGCTSCSTSSGGCSSCSGGDGGGGGCGGCGGGGD